MTESFGVQVSYKFGKTREHMVNIRGENVTDLVENCRQFEAIVTGVLDIATLLNPVTEEEAIQEIQNQMGGQVIAQTGPVCQHGQMTLKSGASWSAYMCPARQGDPTKCQPIDAKTGRPWPKKG